MAASGYMTPGRGVVTLPASSSSEAFPAPPGHTEKPQARPHESDPADDPGDRHDGPESADH